MIEIRTYVVRVYQPDSGFRTSGTVEWVPSGRVSAFRNLKELTALLRQRTRAAGPAGRRAVAKAGRLD